MVYGILGKRRVPLPACAYHQLGKYSQLEKVKSIVDLKQMMKRSDTLHNDLKEVNAGHMVPSFWRLLYLG